jgi:predicted metal-binding protein
MEGDMFVFRLIPIKTLIDASYEPLRVLGYCKSCPNYNRNYSCPDHAFSTEHYLNRFEYALIVKHSLMLPQGLLQADFFLSSRRRIDPLLMKLENHFQAEALLPGCCHNCHTDCSKLTFEDCCHPELRRYSLESLGIDINKMLQAFFAVPLQFLDDRITLVYGFLPHKMPPASIQAQLESELKSIDC